MAGVGAKLREAREAQGKSLEEMAAFLYLRRSVLEALEEERWSYFSEPVLLRGYLKSYAQSLGLDPHPLLEALPTLSTPTVPPAPRQRSYGWWVALVLILVIGGGVWALYRHRAGHPTTVVVPPPPAPQTYPKVTLQVLSQPSGAQVFLDGFLLGSTPLTVNVQGGPRILQLQSPGYQTYQTSLDLQSNETLRITLHKAPLQLPSPSTSPTPTSTTGTLTILLTGKSWLKVSTPKGTILYEGIPPQGSRLNYPLPVIVRVGNAGGVSLFLNGTPLPPLGPSGAVVQKEFPSPQGSQSH